MRTFISLEPDENTKDQILYIQNDLRKSISSVNRQYNEYIKWEMKNKFHVTLFFIGDTDESLLNIADKSFSHLGQGLNTGSILFRSGGVNAFPKLRYPRVLILDLLNDDRKVFVLQSEISQILKNTGIQSDKRFHPHVTLGRVKRDRKINLSDLKFKPEYEITFSVNDFCLMESKLKSSGSEYLLLKKYSARADNSLTLLTSFSLCQ